MYNFFHTSNYKIQNLQIYLDFLLGVNLSKINYNFNLDMKYQGENDLQYYHKNDISNSILYNYKSGIVLTTKINDLSLIQLKGYLNYNDFSGYIYTQTNYISSYIKSIFSYGFDLGIAINF